jgi:cell division protein FtsW (lipid II flippase)
VSPIGRLPGNAPVIAALVGGMIAIAIGLAIMAGSGAPLLYSLVNGAALTVGLMLAAVLLWLPPRPQPLLALAAALALLATALFGVEMNGIRRWVSLFGLVQIQPAFILLPLLLCHYARRAGDHWHDAALIIASLAIALMPDRSMALALVMVSFVVWLADRNRPSALVLAAASIALAITLWRADPLDAVEHVEQVLQRGWQSGPLTGAALSLGALAMLAPFLTARVAAPEQQRAIIAFILSWGMLLIASLVGAYPTPLLGYGASAIIGYVVSITVLRQAEAAAPASALRS